MKHKIKALICIILAIMMFALYGCEDKGKMEEENLPATEIIVDIMEAPYRAAGDGKTSDREIIQCAINDVARKGGGKVVLTAGHTFLTGNLYLQSNVELHFGDGARLVQNPDENDYIYPMDEVDEDGVTHKRGDPWIPCKGTHFDGNELFSKSPWNHAFAWNYPLIYAAEGSKNIKVTGNGFINTVHEDCASTIHQMIFVANKVDGLTLSDFTIDAHNGWAMEVLLSDNVLVKDITIKGFQCSCTDGLHIIECQNVRVTGCDFDTGDDALAIISIYGDPRYFRWTNCNEERVNKNIVIDHCRLMVSDPANMKGLAIFYWGKYSPDMSKTGFSDIIIRDNDICSVGVWNQDAMGDYVVDPYYNYKEEVGYPAKNIRWSNNKVDIWQESFFNLFEVSDFMCDEPGIHSMEGIRDGDFEYAGLGFWNAVAENGSIAEVREDNGTHYGYLGSLNMGNAKLYEGIFLRFGTHTLSAKIKTGEGAKVRIFVCTQDDKIIASKEVSSENGWLEVTLDIFMPGNSLQGKNVRVGAESIGDSGWAMIDDFVMS